MDKFNNSQGEAILKAIAPCSLCCYACPAMKGGAVEETSKKLLHYLEGYQDFLEESLPKKYRSYAKKIGAFTEQLEHQAHPSCNGCRDNTHGKCCIKGCFILDCTQKHGVEFCAYCNEFPCSKLTEDVFGATTISEWKKGNLRIKEVGIERFYEEATSRSHYLPYKKDGKKQGKFSLLKKK